MDGGVGGLLCTSWSMSVPCIGEEVDGGWMGGGWGVDGGWGVLYQLVNECSTHSICEICEPTFDALSDRHLACEFNNLNLHGLHGCDGRIAGSKLDLQEG